MIWKTNTNKTNLPDKEFDKISLHSGNVGQWVEGQIWSAVWHSRRHTEEATSVYYCSTTPTCVQNNFK